jgi:glyoxylase-like metal-dependent hydrolase (beta-lactamase superfamily II)
MDTVLLQNTLLSMQKVYGLKAIDALIVTHMHGDHFLEAPFLKKNWDTPVWALENMVAVMEQPLNYDFSAMIPAYNHGFESIHVNRVFRPGETFNWEDYTFTIDWMPGQTKYALCLHGQIDGRKVAFTGDNIFADPDNPEQNGHEALVARNDAILEEGYIYAGEYLNRLQPDILIGGHSFVMDHPARLIERYKKWGYEMREVFRGLSSEQDYRYWFDPYWVHAEPYRIRIKRGEESDYMLSVRNFLDKEQHHVIKIHAPKGITPIPAVIEGKMAPESKGRQQLHLRVDKTCPVGVYILAFDITIEGHEYGELFDAVLIVE